MVKSSRSLFSWYIWKKKLLKILNFPFLSGQSQKPVCMFYFLSLTLMRCHDNMEAVKACDDGMLDKMITVYVILMLVFKVSL